MKKNTKIFLLIIILIILIIFIISKSKKLVIYSLYLNYILDPMLKYKYNYFFKNFNQKIQPYLKKEITIDNKTININRKAKNEYALLDKSITKDIFNDLENIKTNKESLDILIKNVLNYVHLDGKKVNQDDLIFLDALTISGNYFPFFHTDVEWNTFCMNDGFQIWILLKEDEDIKPRGNMFIMETDIVEPGRVINIKKNKVNLEINGSGTLNPKVIKEYNSLNDINPTIRYLNAKVGEVFIMNQNVFHCSDPFKLNCKRKAINIRLIHKNSNKLRICKTNFKKFDMYNKYIILLNKLKKKEKYYEIEDSNNLKYKFI